jgi:hypothetical protein
MTDRWMAEISYLTGRTTQVMQFEELKELHNLVEYGPDWNEIDQIIVVLNRPSLTPKTQP